jgi:hypothetical protein
MWEQTVVGSFLITAQQFAVKKHYILTARHIHHISTSHVSRYDCQTHNFSPVDRMADAGHILFLGSIKAERCFKHSLYLKWTTYDLNIGFQSPCNSQSGVTCREVQMLVLMSVRLATYLTIQQAASFSKDAIHGNGACIVWITWLGDAIRIRTLQTAVVHSHRRHSVPFHFMPNTLIYNVTVMHTNHALIPSSNMFSFSILYFTEKKGIWIYGVHSQFFSLRIFELRILAYNEGHSFRLHCHPKADLLIRSYPNKINVLEWLNQETRRWR